MNIAKISVAKLAKIGDPQSKLRKAVLINNVIKMVKDDITEPEQRLVIENQMQTEVAEVSHSPLNNNNNNRYSSSIDIQSFKERNTFISLDEEKNSMCDEIIKEMFDNSSDPDGEKFLNTDKNIKRTQF